MNKAIKDSIVQLYNDGSEILKKFSDDVKNKRALIIAQEYQIWYTKASIIVKEILPNRYDEFAECYKCLNRKGITYSNFSIYDYITGVSCGRQRFDPKATALIKFINQINIIKSISESVDNVLFNIKNSMELEILDDELLSSRKLWKKGYLRSAGALCGVILEKHFSTMLKNHNLKLSKKEPCISDYNDLFKQENIYDIINWRFIQHLGDIRNLCDHNKDREPTKDEVDELINGTDKVIKTIF